MTAAGPAPPKFSIASAEELWLRGILVESRITHGTATRGSRSMTAIDTRDDELVALCHRNLDESRHAVAGDARVRLVATARRIAGKVLVESTTTITIDGVSIVGNDVDALRSLLAIKPRHTWTGQPLLWKNGSAAVLLHEAVGHPAEHHARAVRWPSWLQVSDEPHFDLDDCGEPTRTADLLVEPPAARRCESFRHLPLTRMSNLVARQNGAPFDAPEGAVEIELVHGGSYDPLTDLVTIDVAISSAGPFTFRRPRGDVARSIAGADGEPIRYPGVICSREGQELAIGSYAPLMVTR